MNLYLFQRLVTTKGLSGMDELGKRRGAEVIKTCSKGEWEKHLRITMSSQDRVSSWGVSAGEWKIGLCIRHLFTLQSEGKEEYLFTRLSLSVGA